MFGSLCCPILIHLGAAMRTRLLKITARIAAGKTSPSPARLADSSHLQHLLRPLLRRFAFMSGQDDATGDLAAAAAAAISPDPPHSAGMGLEEKYALVRSIGEECIQDDELRNLLAKKTNPVAYDGFEPSGRMHIAQPVRDHFKNNSEAKELLKTIKVYRATR